MNAEPLLKRVTRLLAKHRLETVLIGNAAGAIQGSPVTTLDLDFMFRKTAANLEKLEHFRYVQSSGGMFNGSTHFDYTNYFEALPSNALERGLFLA